MTEMMGAVLGGLERVVKKDGQVAQESRISFDARKVTFEGDLSIRLPGIGEYGNLTRVDIESGNNLRVALSGLLKQAPNGIQVKEGRAAVTGYREDRNLRELDREVRLVKDPEVTIYTSDGKRFVYNQVQGMPVVGIKSGKAIY